MITKAENPRHLISQENISPLVEFYYCINHLKQIYRQGWLRTNIPTKNCESVAEHTLAAALLAMVFANAFHQNLDMGKLLTMVLIHDIGEIIAGDIIPNEGIDKIEKYLIEKEAVNEVFVKISNGDFYTNIWEEYEAGVSPEAQFARQIDKFEMAFQASVYEHQHEANLLDFFETASSQIHDRCLVEIFDELVDLRK